jgi:endonuclease YncB( thermonuclease family)
MMRRGAGLVLLAIALASRALAQTVTDGDTLKLNGTTYRLWGIDAPESKQSCGDYPAGIMATGTLQMLIKGKTVVCEPKATDRYGRTVALCRADGEDLGRTMVQLGMAWAFVRYSRDYVEQEALASMENLGIHAHQCVFAWEWRAQQRR